MQSSPISPDKIRVALTGAAGGFGRTVLMALRTHPKQRPAILCDIDTDAVAQLLADLGYPPDAAVECVDHRSVDDAVTRGRIAVVADTDLISPSAYDVLIEATGVVGVSVRAALAAIDAHRHVVLVSKETESLFGRELSRRAAARGVVCTTGAGDQPANLVALLEWAARAGLDVVAAGKSSEYDLVFDPTTGQASVPGGSLEASELASLWSLTADIAGDLERRRSAVAGLPLGAAADYCEITVVANLTGMSTDTPRMHYPIARYRELADIFRLRDEGGILQSPRTLDVFTLLRTPDEASFAGGEFIVARCPDPAVARTLAEKGHVVSRSHDHVLVGLPFHLMGLEIAGTISDAVEGRPVAAPHPARSVMTARATRALPAGTALRVAGHHHEIDGLTPEVTLVEATEQRAVPFYLLGGTVLRTDIAAGDVVRFDDVDGIDPLLADLVEDDRIPTSTTTTAAAAAAEGAQQ